MGKERIVFKWIKKKKDVRFKIMLTVGLINYLFIILAIILNLCVSRRSLYVVWGCWLAFIIVAVCVVFRKGFVDVYKEKGIVPIPSIPYYLYALYTTIWIGLVYTVFILLGIHIEVVGGFFFLMASGVAFFYMIMAANHYYDLGRNLAIDRIEKKGLGKIDEGVKDEA